MTASSAPRSVLSRLGLGWDHLDLTFVTVLAIAWISAVVATCVTLWILVGVVGNS